jgi:tRNA-splicing ligase RtcB (3'-phosphate/5'-hydroxy nucleic acid ligase)
MVKIEGNVNMAKVFTNEVEDAAFAQIKLLCDQEFTKSLKIRIMPDVHAGVGCTIGTTMTIKDKVVPNLVGVDIGCGMETVKLKNKHIELEKLDKLIYEKIPSGYRIRETNHKYNEDINLNELRCLKEGKINISRAQKSLGTLGGGNHFIEVDKDEDGKLYLVVHSGSRHLGLEVAGYYQEQAYQQLDGREKSELPKTLAYVQGRLMEDYIHDMKLVQRYAVLNRKAIMDELIRGMKLKIEEEFTTIHNYIDTDQMILRKGAVSAKKGEKLLIPINMRDGSLICIGKGNEDWNQSAPHGAGRLMSRKEAKNSFTVSEFKKEMKGVYTTSVNAQTLDECPMAYKEMEDIIKHIADTAEIVSVIQPIYNYKAAE